MGGGLALLVGRARPERLSALIGVAAGSDFTDWGFTQEQKLQILREGRIEEPSEYGDAPKVTTKAFWHSGGANRLLHGTIAVDCPVRLLHGQRDERSEERREGQSVSVRVDLGGRRISKKKKRKKNK